MLITCGYEGKHYLYAAGVVSGGFGSSISVMAITQELSTNLELKPKRRPDEI